MYLEIGGVTDSALRLKWRSKEIYSGYIVEQKNAEKWERIVWIGDGSITTCRVEELKPFTVYQFRITPFIYDNFYHEILGKSEEIVGKTAPPNISDIKAKYTPAFIEFSWKWNENAQGCIWEQKEHSEWKRIARIADKKICSFQLQNPNADEECEIRVKTFAFWGKRPTYSAYKYLISKETGGLYMSKGGE